MLGELSSILLAFAPCFSRNAAFRWFMVVIFGFLVRLDFHGVTAWVRWLALNPEHYETLLRFFRASSWQLKKIQQCWVGVIQRHCPLMTLSGHLLMVGDGIKISKEAKRMPGVKKLHQESDNSGKAPFIFGHHFGVVGFLAGTCKSIFCLPAMAEIHEGVERLRAFQGKQPPVVEGEESVSVVTLMLALASNLARFLARPSMVILDAYFAVSPAFVLARECLDQQGQRLLHVLTRAKDNVVGYDPTVRNPRGRPAKWGKRVKLRDQFQQRASEFRTISLDIYGKRTTLSYLCLDLFWKPIQQKVRFVLVKNGHERFILMCSHLGWSPEDIILAYGYRFKIEVTFKSLKHLLGSFAYHFWTSAVPKLSKKKVPVDLSGINEAKQRLIATTADAIEGFVNFGCIALGLLQILAINYPQIIWAKYSGWLRTKRCDIPSEEMVRSVIQETFYHHFRDFKDTAIYQIITTKQRHHLRSYDSEAA